MTRRLRTGKRGNNIYDVGGEKRLKILRKHKPDRQRHISFFSRLYVVLSGVVDAPKRHKRFAAFWDVKYDCYNRLDFDSL